MNIESKRQLQGADISPAEALKHLRAGATLVTATSALVSDWKRRVIPHSSSVVTTPAIFTWHHWLTGIASSCPDMPVPLTVHQETQLWEQMIRRDLSRYNLPQGNTASVRGLAKHAANAWMLMQDYRIDVQELASCGEEAEALARWIAAMQLKLASKAFEERTLIADVPKLLYKQLSCVDLPECFIMDGFESLTPMQQRMLDALQQHGCEMMQVQERGQTAEATWTPCPDESGECRHIAERIKVLLDRDKSMRIAVLTTESIRDVAVFRRALDDVLIPDACLHPERDIQSVTIAGDALSDWPMVGQALHFLSLTGKQHITFDEFSPLLFAPWLAGYRDERMARAALDASFREQNRRYLSLKGLLKSAGVQDLPPLSSVIRALEGWKTRQQSAAAWVKSVHALLLTAGFVRTGLEDESPLNNLEIRQMNAFRDVLTSLVSLDAVSPPLSWHEFLSRLRTACAEARFGLAAMYPNVVVMPLNQAAGMEFEHVFVMGMDEEVFPPPVRPQPLLPVHVQRKYGIPMSSGSQVFESSRWLWDQVARIAPTIECSYAQHKDEREMLPSSFVAGLAEKCVEETTRLPQRLELEDMKDTTDVPLRADEHIRGGTAIIKNQSACPFRAFATHRLGITTLGETAPGIESSDQGALIHLALEFIWEKLESQAALLALTERARADLINMSIEHAWRESRIFRDSGVQAIEKKRMRQVLDAWLDVEAARPPFEVVEREKTYHLTLPEDAEHACPMRIKVDRMDKDAQDHRILIDYKTGKPPSISQWMGERMAEPQLPLYALAAEIGADDAVAFAAVRSGDAMGFAGLAGEDTGITGMKACDGKHGRPEDWQQTLDNWREHINALAKEFVAGRSEVAPRDKHACDYCGLEAVCRVEETGFVSDVEDDA